MRSARHIILVDGDLKRRAAISHYLGSHGIHVEPYEGVTELTGHGLRRGLILVNDMDGTISALTDHLVQSGNWLPIVAFAETPAPRQIVDAMLGGAIDYLAWPFDDAELRRTLEYAEVRAENVGNARLRQAMARSRIEHLTPREREVLVGIAAGHSNRTIADQLAISPRTVEIHRANMLTKIGAANTSEAIRIAIEAALIRETSI